MNKLQLSGAALIIGAAAMFSMSPVFADDMAASSTPAMKCIDSTPEAKVIMDKDGNAFTTQEACEAASGKWVDNKDATATAPTTTPTE